MRERRRALFVYPVRTVQYNLDHISRTIHAGLAERRYAGRTSEI